MASYYYLLASLPMLRADGEMPFPYSRFLEMCKPSVSAAKYALLENLALSSGKGPLLADWAKFYAVLHRELVYFRNRRLDRPVQGTFERDEAVSRQIAAAVNGKNPLEAERALLALEFEKLDELIGMHYFDDQALFGYALKLKLLERKTVFDQKKGKEELDRILDILQKQIMLGGQE